MGASSFNEMEIDAIGEIMNISGNSGFHDAGNHCKYHNACSEGSGRA